MPQPIFSIMFDILSKMCVLELGTLAIYVLVLVLVGFFPKYCGF